MKPRLKGKQYEISYRCPGYDRPFFERFATIQEANLRIAQIELDKSNNKVYKTYNVRGRNLASCGYTLKKLKNTP